MLLFHVSPATNNDSITRRGLLRRCATGRRKVVWLHTATWRDWAIMHCAERHGEEQMALYAVQVPRSWLRRSGRRSRWICVRDIPTSRISFLCERCIHESANDPPAVGHVDCPWG